MKERGERIPVVFRWPDGGNETGLDSRTAYDSAIPLQQRKG